ncbi:hypothetical protein [Polynucleobacter ibericus]|uniref:hypothetical protein n=1 Tax=Polynucleobacter ibericus TaxID=1819725 RepID=UPI001BFCF9B3|nr:hypothetical protein [Polynucleobacter ibericus]QWE09504.1 transporter [Polynucleobacter ibericus]
MPDFLNSLPNVYYILSEITGSLTNFGIRLMSFIAVLVVLVHGVLILIIMSCFHAFNKRYSNFRNKKIDGLVYFTVVLLILFSHLIDIFIWTYAMVSVEVYSSILNTFYFAGEMYTNLDHNDPIYVLSSQWRMLPILISFSGLFAVAISGAALYSLLICTFTDPVKNNNQTS